MIAILVMGSSELAVSQSSQELARESNASQATPSHQEVAPEPLPYTGINLAGGEFYDPIAQPDPIYGRDFIYPGAGDFDYFISKGANIIRLPFRWETLQRTPRGPIVAQELDRLKAVVSEATERGLTVILDPHNYARHYGKIVGSESMPAGSLADFWRRLARVFTTNPKVWFGLMNEPHDLPTQQWVRVANEAIAAIRATGAANVILVPGNGWSAAAQWDRTWYGSPNSIELLNIRDSMSNFLIGAHLYLDPDGSGKSPEVVSDTIGAERLRDITQWCRRNGLRAFLSEFAAPPTPLGAAALDTTLRMMEGNRDVWVGFSWWAAGGWWRDYMFSLQPEGGTDRPQMRALRPHMQARPVIVEQAP